MLGEALRAIREARGLTQEGLADEAGIHRNYVSLLERGQKSPTVATLLRICHALDVKPSAVFVAFEDEALAQLPKRRPRPKQRHPRRSTG